MLYRNPDRPPPLDDRRFPAGLSQRASRCSTSRSPPPMPTTCSSPGSPPAARCGTATSRQWTFENPVVSRFPPGQPPEFETLAHSLTIDSWSETPWQLIKPGLSAAYLGIPDLNGWLQAHASHQTFADSAPYLTQWHYRWALPFTCLVTVLLATPAGHPLLPPRPRRRHLPRRRALRPDAAGQQHRRWPSAKPAPSTPPSPPGCRTSHSPCSASICSAAASPAARSITRSANSSPDGD